MSGAGVRWTSASAKRVKTSSKSYSEYGGLSFRVCKRGVFCWNLVPRGLAEVKQNGLYDIAALA
jgi:hypothetical protein